MLVSSPGLPLSFMAAIRFSLAILFGINCPKFAIRTSLGLSLAISTVFYFDKVAVLMILVLLALSILLFFGFYGPKFTWCNNLSGPARILIRLDRAFGNQLFSSRFPNFLISHLPRTASDHAPLLVKFYVPVHRPRCVFRFYQSTSNRPAI